MTIRTLVIDDSATMRALLMARLADEADIEVIGTASNAVEGRELIRQLNPDVVTLDIEMPGMNGLDFLEKIMTLRPTPVIIVSGSTQKGNEITARALALGAVDCYSKSDPTGKLMLDDNGMLANLIREAAQVRFAPRAAPAVPPLPTLGSVTSPQPLAQLLPSPPPVIAQRSAPPPDLALIAVGSSTGGVSALQTLLADFTPQSPPVLIVQHVNPRFAPAIARTLDQASRATVQLAEPDMPLKTGHVYLAPGDDRHLMIGRGRTGFYIRLRRGEPVSGHLPSVDVLFDSVAELAGAQAAGVLLTGMGADGARGLLAMARAGAFTVAQDEATCTVFGMPRAAIALGAAGVVAPIDRIAQHVLRKAA